MRLRSSCQRKVEYGVHRCIFIALAICSCSGPTTRTSVSFEADPELERRAQTLWILLIDDESGLSFRQEFFSLNRPIAERRIHVVPANGDASSRFIVIAELRDADGSALARVRADTGFVHGELREIWLRFDAECEAVVCSGTDSCRVGVCGSECVPPAVVGGPRPSLAFDCHDPGDIQTCERLCALAPETSMAEWLCASEVADDLGYLTDSVPCNIFAEAVADGVATVDQCGACYETALASDSDCQTVHADCYWTPP